MTLAPRPRSTAADLARLLACWLAAIVLLQAIGAAQALGRGPLHRHVESVSTLHQHSHGAAERHHHAASDMSLLAATDALENSLDLGAFALTAALALMALATARVWRDTRRHVWRAAASWAWRTHSPTPLLKPPRQG